MNDQNQTNHFRSMQAGLVNGVISLGMVALVFSWPGLGSASDYELFFASMVVLIHWHYGCSFVLHHFGPNLRLNSTLQDSLMLFLLLGIAASPKNPVAWHLLNAAAYALAWMKYRHFQPEGIRRELVIYIHRKMLVDLLACGACFAGALACWLWPGQAQIICAGALLGNLLAAYILSEWLRLYDVEPRLKFYKEVA